MFRKIKNRLNARRKVAPKYVIFDGEGAIGDGLNYDDVPKYVASLDQIKESDNQTLFENTLNMLVNTGHPLALSAKFNQLITEGSIQEANNIASDVKTMALKDDHDAMLNWGAWVLQGRIDGDSELALSFMRKLANRGFADQTVYAAFYYLRKCSDVEKYPNEQDNINKLNDWLQICRPDVYQKFRKGKLTQEHLLEEVAAAAGMGLL